jgi:hypothetical protein
LKSFHTPSQPILASPVTMRQAINQLINSAS